jgi:nitroreductase
MIAPSERTCQLSEIAYQTTLKKKLGSLSHGAPEDERIAIQESVAKKRQKWDQIPAFLVTLVASEHKLVSEATTASMDPYEPIAFQPPTSERELEDYATACASVQNCLLSLHAENIASKWVTGEVIATPAFRKLVKAKENDRVVALIMVGEEDEQAKKTHPRRMRRHIHGDVLVDL